MLDRGFAADAFLFFLATGLISGTKVTSPPITLLEVDFFFSKHSTTSSSWVLMTTFEDSICKFN